MARFYHPNVRRHRPANKTRDRRRWRTLLLAALLLCCMTGAVSIADESRRVPQRIVVFPLFAQEMLLEMVGPDRVVYVGYPYVEHAENVSPAMALAKGIPGSLWTASDPADILALKPDLIVLAEPYPELEEAGIAVLRLQYPKTIEDITQVLITVGEAVAAPQKAARMAAEMQTGLASIAAVVSRIPEEQRVRAAHCRDGFERMAGELYCYSFAEEFALVAGAAGVLAMDVPGAAEGLAVISGNQLRAWNPGLIAVPPVGYDTDGTILTVSQDEVNRMIDALTEEQALSSVPAVITRNIHPLWLSQSHCIVQSAEALARLAYPGLFEKAAD